jgi:glycosyltransferase involved in cell wall biosynthesis
VKVAYLVPSLGLQEGQGTANLEIMRRIARAGHTIDVFTSHAPPLVRTLAGVRVHRVPRLPVWQLGNQLISLVVTGATARGRWDVVHADAGVTLKRADVISIHTISDRWLRLPDEVWREPGMRGRHNDAATRFKARLEIRHARAARVVLANSTMTADDLVERGVARERIRIVPFGVDRERFRPPSAEERAAARAGFAIGADEFVCAFVGAHGPRKGLPLALDVAERTGAHLLVAGEHRGGRHAEDARARGIRATMPGKLADVRRVYWAADAFLYPTRYDAFGMAVLEAMACGLPALVSADAGSAEVVADDAGSVLPATDVDAWVAAAETLRDDPLGRAVAGARAREIASARDWDEAGHIVLQTYAELPT